MTLGISGANYEKAEVCASAFYTSVVFGTISASTGITYSICATRISAIMCIVDVCRAISPIPIRINRFSAATRAAAHNRTTIVVCPRVVLFFTGTNTYNEQNDHKEDYPTRLSIRLHIPSTAISIYQIRLSKYYLSVKSSPHAFLRVV